MEKINCSAVAGVAVLLTLPILAGAVEVQYQLKDSSSDPVSVQIDAKGVVITDTDLDGSPELQKVGGRAEMEKFNNKNLQTADLDRDGAEDVVVSETSRQTPKRDFGDRVQIRGWDPDRKEALEAKLKLITDKDENIAKAEVEQEKIKISYRRPAKLLGFIPVAYYHAFTMDGKGNISHGKPWWLALASSDANDFASEVSAAFQNNQSNLDFLRLQDLVARQSRAFEILSNILKTRHDVAMNAIRNMK